jgi:hypothetical protein
MPKGSYAASVRRAQTIGANTQSIVFTLLQVNGAAASDTPQTFGLTASSTGCTTDSTTQNLACTLPLAAPIGQNDVFLAQTYSGPNGTGSLTGSGAVAFNVVRNAVNTASISLSAQVASVYLLTSSGYLGPKPYASSQPASSTVNSMRVFVVALDSANNIILNPSSYDKPITLQLGFPNGAPDVTLSATYAAGDQSPCPAGGSASASGAYGYLSICSPSDVVTATLVTAVPNGANYGNIIGSIGAAPFYPTPAPGTSPSPLPSNPAGLAYTSFYIASGASGPITLTDSSGKTLTSLETGSSTYTYITEGGFTGSFTVTPSAGCSGVANVSLYYNSYGNVPGVGYTYYGLISASGIAAGTCSATVSDGTNTITVPVTVTTTSVTGS